MTTQAQPSRQPQIFILGAYGHNNLGDDALLETFIHQFKDARLVVNSAKPEETERQFGVKAVKTYLGVPRFTRLHAFLNSDLIIFGGGSLLKEIEGGFLSRLAYMLRILIVLVVAKLLGKPTAMLGVGIGPLMSGFFMQLAKIAAGLTTLICVRDTASRDLLAQLGVKRPAHVTADAVFSLPMQPATIQYHDRPIIAVAPRYSLSDAQRAEFARACDWMVEQYNSWLVFVPFQTGYLAKYDDAEAVEDIRSRMCHRSHTEVLTSRKPSEVVGVIGSASMVVGARLHALIFGAMQAVPAVAIGYEPKVTSFMAESGQSSACLDMQALDEGRLISVIDAAWQARESAREALRERVPAMRAQSQQNFGLARPLLNQQGGRSLIRGSAFFFISATIVNAGNYAFNLLLGRALGPAAYTDLSLIVTLFLLMSFLATSLGMVAAKHVASAVSEGDAAKVAALRKQLNRWAYAIGIVVALLFVGGAQIMQQIFNTASWIPFALLGIGMPLYLAQAVDRGVLQGQTRFGRLALSYQVEMWTRLIIAIILVALGFGVIGASLAMPLSFIATWLVAREARIGLPRAGKLSDAQRRIVTRFALAAGGALIGQILINNSDVLIVKHFFDPLQAGQYAALALIGRIVFFATWSVVTTSFPIVAQKHQKGEPHHHLLVTSLGMVGAVSAVIIGATLIFPIAIVNLLFGPAYLSIAPLLWMYAVATALYALANVVVNYRLSAGSNLGSGMVVIAGVAQVIGLWFVHGTLINVVLVQVGIMATLLIVTLIWNGALQLRHRAAKGAIQLAAVPAR